MSHSSESSTRSQHRHRNLPPLQPNDSRDIVNTRLSGETQRDDYGAEAVPVYDSPATYSTQATSPPQSVTLRSRKTKTLTTAAPQAVQPIERQLQRKQTHIENSSIKKAFQRSILHILPSFVTSILFVLCAAEVYMGDLDGFPGQDVVLQAFQFVVKAHEILMTMSLGDIVLHRIRYDLIVRAGVPFGLLTSAYQIGDLGYLFSAEFIAAVWKPRSHDPSSSRLILSFLVVVSCLLCLVVGPSSGILLIPRLSWWPLKRPFGRTNLRMFTANSTQALSFPNPLPYYGCGGWLCPSYGAGAIATWASSLLFNDASAQVPFIDGGDNFYRWLISNSTDYDGWTATTSPMMSASTIIGEYWNWISYQGLAPAVSLAQPQLTLAYADGNKVMQPLVQTQCNVDYTNATQLDLTLPNNLLVSTQTDAYTDLTWPIPSNYSDVDLSKCVNNVCWSPLPLENYKNAPSLGMLFVLMDTSGSTAKISCSFLAHWVPSDLRIFPKTDRNIHTTFANPIDIVHRSDIDLSPTNQIALSDKWWNMLFTDGPTSTPIEDILVGISMGPADNGLQQFHTGSQGLPYRISTMMGMYLTDAVSRYVHVNSMHAISQDSRNGSKPFAHDLGSFDWDNLDAPAGHSSWLQYAETSPQWREATVSVQRYGYAWSFSGILSKFAGIALLVQDALALAHIILVLHGRWSSSAWDSIGNMIALALRSRSPAFPPDRRTGDERKETWAETVSVRVVENELELMFNPTRAETLRLLQR